jgi:hypothetical protein
LWDAVRAIKRFYPVWSDWLEIESSANAGIKDQSAGSIVAKESLIGVMLRLPVKKWVVRQWIVVGFPRRFGVI